MGPLPLCILAPSPHPGKHLCLLSSHSPPPPPAPGGPGLSVSVDSDSRSLMKEQVHDTWPLVSVLSPSGHTVVSVLSPSGHTVAGVGTGFSELGHQCSGAERPHFVYLDISGAGLCPPLGCGDQRDQEHSCASPCATACKDLGTTLWITGAMRSEFRNRELPTLQGVFWLFSGPLAFPCASEGRSSQFCKKATGVFLWLRSPGTVAMDGHGWPRGLRAGAHSHSGRGWLCLHDRTGSPFGAAPLLGRHLLSPQSGRF